MGIQLLRNFFQQDDILGCHFFYQIYFLSHINSYEPTRHYFGATELNTAGRRAEILARWTVFTKAAIEHRRMELALCN